nr:hypothetical protein [Variovorax boronicumulans]
MAYAAYKEFVAAGTAARGPLFQVLDVTVPLADAHAVRRALLACDGADILRCEPLPRPGAACASAAPRARLTLHLADGCFEAVAHRVLACTPDGEFGRLVSWRDHLRQRGLPCGF